MAKARKPEAKIIAIQPRICSTEGLGVGAVTNILPKFP